MAAEHEFTVRRLRSDEVPKSFELIEQEDFGLTRQKYFLLCETFPEAFFVIVTEEEEIAGTVSFVETLPRTFELGYMVIKSTMRKRGLGGRLIDGVRDIVQPQAVAITVKPGTEHFYQTMGFNKSNTLKTHTIYILLIDRDDVQKKVQEIGPADDFAVTSFGQDEPIDELVAYDSQSRAYDNSRFMTVLRNVSTVLVARDKSTRKIVGFIAGNVYREQILALGGLYADSDKVALHLFKEILALFPDQEIVKFQSFGPRTFLTELGDVAQEITCEKFSSGPIPAVPEEKLYCVCDCDFTL